MTESPQINQDDLSKGERTRLTIMQAAVELFARQGYHGTSMRQIADRAGIALGGIYNHFEGKEDIFRQVSLEYHPIHAILPALEADQGNTVEEFVHQAGDKMYTSLSEGEDFLSLMFIEMVEFKGRHLPMIFKQMFPRALDFSQRMQQKRFGSTADLGAPREVLHKVMDIYLHGILKNEPQE
ncbi:MAG: helix-turn-helix domain containing protein [Anaerolineales bacterium]